MHILYWDKIKYKAKECTAAELWQAVKLHRRLRSNTVTFGNYTFSYMITDYMQRALHQFDMHIGGTLSSNIGIAETDKTKFVISSLMEEAISSSQTEGAGTTRKKAKEMIRQEKKPRTKSKQMILNNFMTMKHIVQHKNDRVLNTKEIESRFNISNFTARTDLNALAGLGFVEVIQVNKKKRNFIKAKKFDRILSKYNI